MENPKGFIAPLESGVGKEDKCNERADYNNKMMVLSNRAISL